MACRDHYHSARQTASPHRLHMAIWQMGLEAQMAIIRINDSLRPVKYNHSRNHNTCHRQFDQIDALILLLSASIPEVRHLHSLRVNNLHRDITLDNRDQLWLQTPIDPNQWRICLGQICTRRHRVTINRHQPTLSVRRHTSRTCLALQPKVA